MSQEPERVRVGAGGLVGAVAANLRYQPSADQVVVVGLNDRTMGVTAAVNWQGTPDRNTDYAAGLAAALADPLEQSRATGALVIGYGPDGPGRAYSLAQELDTYLPVAQVMNVDLDHQSVSILDEGRWGDPEPVADATEFALRLDRVAPAADRDAMMRRYAPLSQLTYSVATPAQQAAIRDTLPSQRVAMVVERLDAIAAPRSDVGPGPRAAAAHAIVSDKTVRDGVITQSVDRTDRTEALLQLYRGAPQAYRGDLATVAGVTDYLTNQGSASASAILEHADRTGPNAGLAELTRTAIDAGIPPERMKTDPARIEAAVERADESHRAEQRRAAGSPTNPREAVQQPPTGKDGPRRPGPAPDTGPDVSR